MKTKPTVAYVIDPRFPGGTSASLARELGVVSRIAHVSIHAVSSRMFKDAPVAPALGKAIRENGLELIWDAPAIFADTVIVQNPAFLKFNTTLEIKIVAKLLVLVSHENFLRPGGREAFDVQNCLSLLDRCTLALQKSIAPISPHNRSTVQKWLQRNIGNTQWSVLDLDWFNICDFSFVAPSQTPMDRRGRHSRPGFEKFPNLKEMKACFPDHADSNVILGGDIFLADATQSSGWTVYPFQGIDLEAYFEKFDFMVYFTARTWRESFGRVLAESIAAGKVVISDPTTASNFGNAVVSCAPSGVDTIVENFISHPERYVAQVESAQNHLAAFSSDKFETRFKKLLGLDVGMPA